ncbi:DUF4233 domain-containing protein [Micrococcoides hystricis]|uniref:DUF4233 domain-containing protein n=1 Tax=Micrococcoides hystricis TaxID=1572761 RepID=A0ABV6P7S5_9MICC
MARLTKAQQEWRPGQIKPRRSVKVLFATTVLSLEGLVLIFFALALFGLHRNDERGVPLLVTGLVLALIAFITVGLLRKPLGYWIGWALQIVLIAGGFLDYTMFFIGIGFGLCWWYAVTKGRQLDIENAERDRLEAEYAAAHDEAAENNVEE